MVIVYLVNLLTNVNALMVGWERVAVQVYILAVVCFKSASVPPMCIITDMFFWITFYINYYYIFLRLDVNECDTDNGGCQQTCNNRDGAFYCSCDRGYTVNRNHLDCDGSLKQALSQLKHMEL